MEKAGFWPVWRPRSEVPRRADWQPPSVYCLLKLRHSRGSHGLQGKAFLVGQQSQA